MKNKSKTNKSKFNKPQANLNKVEQNEGTNQRRNTRRVNNNYRPSGPQHRHGWQQNNQSRPTNFRQYPNKDVPDHHQRWYHDFGSGRQPGRYHKPPNSWQNRYEPGFRPHYFQNPPRQDFLNVREEDPNASLTAVGLLKLLLQTEAIRI